MQIEGVFHNSQEEKKDGIRMKSFTHVSSKSKRFAQNQK
jgi:hypothetical protein